MARPFALVTGASSGIGRAFAYALSNRGHDLVVVARDEGRLKELADELHVRHGTEVEVLTADLTDDDDVARVETRGADDGRPVDLLVNNAGFGVNGRFVDQPVDAADGQIRLNVLAVTRLTHAVLPGMVRRGRGGGVDVGALGAFVPGPGVAGSTAAAADRLHLT